MNNKKNQEKSNQGLVIGRFQLVGNQHVDLFDQIIEYHNEKEKLTTLNVGIGIADIVNANNPFSATECLNMIKPVAEKAASEMGIKTRYRLVNDINDPPNYANHVNEIFGFDKRQDLVKLFSSNNYTTKCFTSEKNYQIIPIEERINQHSTEIRNLYIGGTDISSLVPNHIPKFLEEHNAKKRIERLKYDNPIPTVDVLINYNNGLVLIERLEVPYGLALPGGHVDLGESLETAAIREAKEETNLDVVLTRLVGVFSDPKRDPRGGRISIAYEAQGYGELKACSDAKRAFIVSYGAVPKLVFDHNEIVDYALAKK